MRLLAFGDSWTAGQGIEEYEGELSKDHSYPWDDKGFNMRLRSSNAWPRWLSDKLNCLFVNNGYIGFSNLQILNEIKILIDKNLLLKNDLIIVLFSYPYRGLENSTKTILGGNPVDELTLILEIFNKFENLLSNHKHFYFNAFYPYFEDVPQNIIETLPPYFINPTKTLSDVLIEYEKENDISVWENNERYVENYRGFKKGMYHPNLLGHRIMADEIYNSIKNLL